MKKLLSLLLALVMLLALTACGGSQKPDTDTDGAADAQSASPAEETPAEATESGETTVTYGQITGTPAPEGWVISERSADNYLIYVEKTEAFEESEYQCPYL